MRVTQFGLPQLTFSPFLFTRPSLPAHPHSFVRSWMLPSPLRLLVWLLVTSLNVSAQNISTSMSLPPLQWLNLKQLWATGGAQPPPLRDGMLAFDPDKRVLVLFGGESSSGNPTQQTYVLQMDDLTWRTPEPPDAQQGIPPARSAGAFGLDSASNYRNGLLVWGGKGSTGSTPLDDLWVRTGSNYNLVIHVHSPKLTTVLPISTITFRMSFGTKFQ